MTSADITPPNPAEILPQPLDRRLMGGVAVWNSLAPEHIKDVSERITTCFDILRDTRGEFAACIAYAIGLPDLQEGILDKYMMQQAAHQNDGVVHVLTNPKERGFTLWKGSYGPRSFYLGKIEVVLVMEDYSAQPGKVYTLLGSKEDAETLPVKDLPNAM